MKTITYIRGSREGQVHEYEESEIVPLLVVQSSTEPTVRVDWRGIAVSSAVERYRLTSAGGEFTYIYTGQRHIGARLD